MSSIERAVKAKVLLEMLAPAVQAFPKAFWPSRDARVESLCELYSYIDIRVMSQDEGRGMCGGGVGIKI